MSEAEKYHRPSFEQLRHVGEDGSEYWSARELYPVWEYGQWRNFEQVIENAQEACRKSGHDVSAHFAEASKMAHLGLGTQKNVKDYHISWHGCYLVVQNSDPSTPVVAAGQTCFAIQTRRQELADDAEFQKLSEDQQRLYLRNEIRKHNKQLVGAAKEAGVETEKDYAIFQNHGYQGLYGGLGAKAVHARKLRRDKVTGKDNANRTHCATR